MSEVYVVHVSDLHDHNDTLEAAIEHANGLVDSGKKVIVTHGGDNNEESTTQSFQALHQTYLSLLTKIAQENGVPQEQFRMAIPELHPVAVEIAKNFASDIEELIGEYQTELAARLEVQNEIFGRSKSPVYGILGNHEILGHGTDITDILTNVKFMESGKVYSDQGLDFAGVVNCTERLGQLKFAGEVMGVDLQPHLENGDYNTHDPRDAAVLTEESAKKGLDFLLTHKGFGEGATMGSHGRSFGYGQETYGFLKTYSEDHPLVVQSGHIHGMHRSPDGTSVHQDGNLYDVRSGPTFFNVTVMDNAAGKPLRIDTFEVKGEYGGKFWSESDYQKMYFSGPN